MTPAEHLEAMEGYGEDCGCPICEAARAEVLATEEITVNPHCHYPACFCAICCWEW